MLIIDSHNSKLWKTARNLQPGNTVILRTVFGFFGSQEKNFHSVTNKEIFIYRHDISVVRVFTVLQSLDHYCTIQDNGSEIIKQRRYQFLAISGETITFTPDHIIDIIF